MHLLRHGIFSFPFGAVSSGALLLSLSFLGSKVLGIVRDRLLAGTFGADERLDAFFAAFLVPDFLYAAFILGGISAVFLPLFSEYFKESPQKAWHFANVLLHNFLLILSVSALVLFAAAPWLVSLLMPGFSASQAALTSDLMRIMLLSPVFFGISSVFSGLLHYFQRFAVYALAPILYNLSLIFGILFLYPAMGMQGLALGVILGALLHAAVQIPAALREGFRYRPRLNLWEPGFVKALKLMVPRTIGAMSFHANMIVMASLASTLAVGSVAVFNFAHHLQSIPVGLVGIPFALASFPLLSRSWAEGNREPFRESFSSSLRKVLLLIMPLSFLLFFLREEVVQLLLGVGKFGPSDVALVASAFGVFLVGVFAFALIPLLVRTFYACQDTLTPALVGLGSTLLSVALALLFLFPLKGGMAELLLPLFGLSPSSSAEVIFLPLALSLAGIVQTALLFFFLRDRASLGKGGARFLGHLAFGLFLFASFMIVSDIVWERFFDGFLIGKLLFVSVISFLPYFVYTHSYARILRLSHS